MGLVDVSDRLEQVTAAKARLEIQCCKTGAAYVSATDEFAMSRYQVGLGMRRPSSTKTLACVMVCRLSGCGLFDSGVEWRDGPYELLWIDISEQISLTYDLGR